MDRQLIKTLIDALAASDLSELEYTRGGETLRLVKASHGGVGAVAPASPAATAGSPPPPASTPDCEPHDAIVAAPMYGIVHLHRSPDAAAMVALGESVVAGQVLCLIEAMKVFTELRAERDGTIADILVESGREVEAGQPLFRLSV